MTPLPRGRTGRTSRCALLVLALTVALLVASACGDEERALVGPTIDDDPGPVHVHGLGINPSDGALFIATHTGLFRTGPDETAATRVTDRHQDTMGFTVVGSDRFLGSGHPDLRDDLPVLLGLIESTDAGRSWRAVSLLGEADFHVLRAAGTSVYGFDSTSGRLMVSADGGRSWIARRPPEPLVDLVPRPEDPGAVLAAGERALYRSADAGATWKSMSEDTGLLAWPSRERLYRVDAAGRLSLSRDAGVSWREVGRVEGEHAAFLATEDEDLYVALHDGTILRSGDGGGSWAVRSKP